MYNSGNFGSISDCFVRLFWSKKPSFHCAAGRKHFTVKTDMLFDVLTGQVIFQVSYKEFTQVFSIFSFLSQFLFATPVARSLSAKLK